MTLKNCDDNFGVLSLFGLEKFTAKRPNFSLKRMIVFICNELNK